MSAEQQPCPLCGTENKFNADRQIDAAETDSLIAEINRADACQAAFESKDGRTIATESIGPGVVWGLLDKLEDMTSRFEKCALLAGSAQEFVDIATKEARALLATLKIEEPKT